MKCHSCGKETPGKVGFCEQCAPGSASSTDAELPHRSLGDNPGFYVGRQREIKELQATLNEVISGRGHLVMLTGEPGIGKTRTARELASYAQYLGAQVLWGWCYEEQGAPPYWPWVHPIRGYVRQQTPERLRIEMGAGAADIAEIIPELLSKLPELDTPPALGNPEAARFRLFDSLASFLVSASQTRPLMIILDDLHWADSPSLLFLRFLAHHLGESRLLLVGCYRDEEISRQHPLTDTLAQLSKEPIFRRHLLQGINEEDAALFIEQECGVIPSPEVVASIHALTEGNPFFLTEVVRLMYERGEIENPDFSINQGITVPVGVRDAVGQRLNRRSEYCNRLLSTASIIGGEFNPGLLERVLDDFSEEDLVGALEEALAAGMVEASPESPGSYRFTHALIQNTLSEELSAARRATMHARIGQAFEELQGAETDVTTLAFHFAQAMTKVEPEKLAHYSRLAGERALASYAWEDATLHFQRGLEAKEGKPMDAETAAMLVGSGRTQLSTVAGGRAVDAVAALKRAFDYYISVGDVDSAVAAAEYPMSTSSGVTPGSSELVEQALQMVTPNSLAECRLLVRHGWDLGRMRGDYEAAQKALRRALEIALEKKDTLLEMQSLAAAAEVEVFNLACRESVAKCRRVIELAYKANEPWAESQAHQRATLALTILGSLEGAQHHAWAALASAKRINDHFWLSSALWGKQFVHRLEGNWEESRKTSDLILSTADSTRHLSDRVILEYELGDFATGKSYFTRLLVAHTQTRFGATTGFVMPAVIIPLVNRIDPGAGHVESALSLAEAVISSPSASPLVLTVARAGLALLAFLQGNEEAAQEQYAALAPHRGTMVQTGVISIDRVLGLLSVTMGNHNQAREHFEEGLAFCRAAGYRSEVAWTCHDYADALLPGKDPVDHSKAGTLLTEAEVLAHDLGMRPLKERLLTLREHLRSSPEGVPVIPGELTQREVEVLRLIAQGKSNREIAGDLVLSPRTVAHHITNILSKTNSSNRTEAAAYASRHRLVSLEED